MNRFEIRWIFALLLAVTLPLQGLALAVQNAVTPGHVHRSASAEGSVPTHRHAHDPAHSHDHGPAAPHAHALDDDDVVYVIGDHDPQSTVAFKLPPHDGLPRAGLGVIEPAATGTARSASASTGPLCSRTVDPLRRPPRAA